MSLTLMVFNNRYWCLEGALVAMLFVVDDASPADLHNSPDNLIRYFKETK